MCPQFLVPLLGAVGSIAGVAMQPKAPKPPSIPAVAAAPAQDSNADIRSDADKANDSAAPDFLGFTPKRTQAKTLGGLGASGLGL